MLTAILVSLLWQTTPPEPSERGYVYWQISEQKLAEWQVTVFSVCLDQQPTCTHVKPEDGKMAEFPGWYRWKLPPLLVGDHAVTVQVCNAVVCGPATSAEPNPFTVTIAPGRVDKAIVR